MHPTTTTKNSSYKYCAPALCSISDIRKGLTFHVFPKDPCGRFVSPLSTFQRMLIHYNCFSGNILWAKCLISRSLDRSCFRRPIYPFWRLRQILFSWASLLCLRRECIIIIGLLLTDLVVKYFSLDSRAVVKNALILICLKSQGRIEISLGENTLIAGVTWKTMGHVLKLFKKLKGRFSLNS